MPIKESEAEYLRRRRQESLSASLSARTTIAQRAHQELARSYEHRLAKLTKVEIG